MLETVTRLANARREKRWAKECAATAEAAAHDALRKSIAKWKGAPPSRVKFSNFCCSKAPADLLCVFITGDNPYHNPCVFCGHPEKSIF